MFAFTNMLDVFMNKFSGGGRGRFSLLKAALRASHGFFPALNKFSFHKRCALMKLRCQRPVSFLRRICIGSNSTLRCAQKLRILNKEKLYASRCLSRRRKSYSRDRSRTLGAQPGSRLTRNQTQGARNEILFRQCR